MVIEIKRISEKNHPCLISVWIDSYCVASKVSLDPIDDTLTIKVDEPDTPEELKDNYPALYQEVSISDDKLPDPE